ncbi:MAG: M14 family zinc carboxypeptidase, partial [Planctomycetota bacterium]
SVHTYSDLMLYPWGYNTIVTPDDDVYRQYGSSFTAQNGWPRGTIWQLLYIANGGSVDYHYGEHGTIAFTPEIGSQSDGFWPSPSRITALYAAIQPAYLQTAMYTGAWASVGDLVWTEITGDGDPWQEAGESWSLSVNVENPGTALLAVDLDLSSSDPFLSVSGLPVHLDIAPRSTLQGGNWQVDFASNAPSGQALAMDLQWDFDGWSSNDSLEVTLGRVRVLLRDLMEADDFGWSANNQTNWSWERADPQSTSSGGSEVQAGDDHTANGTLCWVTGAAAGGSVGANDVDGTATLTSPRFSLDGMSNASLHYARWFANRPGGPLNDRWISQLSNNNGVSWIDLEDLGDTGSAWVDTEIELDGVLPFTENMRLRFTVADDPNDDITEGLLDDLEIRTLTDTPSLGLWGDASAGSTVRFVVDGEAGSSYDIAWSSTLSGGSTVPGIAGTLFLTAPSPILNGSCGTDGVGMVEVNLPPSVAGLTLHFQGVVGLGTAAAEFTTPLSISFQ